ncbi:hypothetical protein [Leptospira wolffii]|uniref:hypothetical protein n=1 Tax=Leptospira wolffii TaxID=409998 RepID=UPI000F6478E0|nr:hypothetical protein [Leptospira wolffii]
MNIPKDPRKIEQNLHVILPVVFTLGTLVFALLLVFGVTFPTLLIEENQRTPINLPTLSKIGLLLSIELLIASLLVRKISALVAVNYSEEKPKYSDLLSSILIVLGYLFAFYRGFRMPNLWTMGYFVPSYFDGIYRRALSGTLLYVFGDLRFNYYLIVAVQVSIFLVLNILFIRELFKSNFEIRLLFAIFLFSPAGGYLFHEIGYVDQLLLLLLLIAITTTNNYLSCFLVAISPLFHEEAMFIVIPIYSLSLLFRGEKLEKMQLYSLSLAFCSFLIGIILRSSGSDVASFAMKWGLNANYPLRLDYVSTVLAVRSTAFAAIHYAEHQIVALGITVFVGIISAFTISIRATGGRKYSLFAIGIICIILPLGLGLIGWDTSRWIFLSITASLLVFYVGRENLKGFIFYASLASVLLFSAQVKLRYFDGYKPRELSSPAISSFVREDFFRLVREIPKL